MGSVKNETKYFILDRPQKRNAKEIYRILIAYIKDIKRTFELNYFAPPKDRFITWKGYKVCICAIFKNEAQYLKEWIEYHKIVGIDHFFLYNNNSADNYYEVLLPYVNSGLVTLENWSENYKQLKCYEHCMVQHKGETLWMAFIDLDEFIVPNSTENVYDFLKDFNNRPVVIVYWKFFCTSGLLSRKKSGLVTEDFHVCFPKYDSIGKIFFNTGYDFMPGFRFNSAFHHYMWGGYKGKLLPPVNIFNKICTYGRNRVPLGTDKKEFPMQINHYFSKSYEEYVEKCNKGDVYYELNPHNKDYLLAHERHCTDCDFHIYKYMIMLKMEMKNN